MNPTIVKVKAAPSKKNWSKESFEKGQRFQQLQRFQCPLITYVADEEKTGVF